MLARLYKRTILTLFILMACLSAHSFGHDLVDRAINLRQSPARPVDTYMSVLWGAQKPDPAPFLSGYLILIQQVNKGEFNSLIKQPNATSWKAKLDTFKGLGLALTTETVLWRQVLDVLTKGRDALDAYAKRLRPSDKRLPTITPLIDEINLGMAKIIGGAFGFEARPGANHYEKLHFLARSIVGIGQHMDAGHTPRIMTKGFVSPDGMSTSADQWHVILARAMALIAQNPSLDHRAYTALMASYSSPAVSADQYLAVRNYLIKQKLLPSRSRCTVRPVVRPSVGSDLPDIKALKAKIKGLHTKHKAGFRETRNKHIEQTLNAMFTIAEGLHSGALMSELKTAYDTAKSVGIKGATERGLTQTYVFLASIKIPLINVQKSSGGGSSEPIGKIFENVEYAGLAYGDLPEWKVIRDQILRTHLYDGVRHLAKAIKLVEKQPFLEGAFLRGAFSPPDFCLAARNITLEKWVGFYSKLFSGGDYSQEIYKNIIHGHKFVEEYAQVGALLKIYKLMILKQLKEQGTDYTALGDLELESKPKFAALYSDSKAVDWVYDTIRKAYLSMVGASKSRLEGGGKYTRADMEAKMSSGPFSSKAEVQTIIEGLYIF